MLRNHGWDGMHHELQASQLVMHFCKFRLLKKDKGPNSRRVLCYTIGLDQSMYNRGTLSGHPSAGILCLSNAQLTVGRNIGRVLE